MWLKLSLLRTLVRVIEPELLSSQFAVAGSLTLLLALSVSTLGFYWLISTSCEEVCSMIPFSQLQEQERCAPVLVSDSFKDELGVEYLVGGTLGKINTNPFCGSSDPADCTDLAINLAGERSEKRGHFR